jgi:PIN domain
MAKIIKAEPPVHLLIADTNVLWLEDKGPIVNPEFDKFWDDHKNLLRIELCVPEVVRDELMYQHCASGKKLIDKIGEHMSSFSSITAKKHRHRLSEDALRKLVRKKFDRWLNSKDAKIVQIAIATINWKDLYDKAIWRIPPFAADAKNPKNEKGFRDALIFETVVDLANKKEPDVNIAFISNDFILRNALAEELCFDVTFLCFEGLAEFSSYIKLTREQLTEAFIGKIVKRAAEKFYTAGDANCLWNKDKISERLVGIEDAWRLNEIEPKVSYNLPSALTSLGSLASGGIAYTPIAPPRTWRRTALNNWHLGPHVFVKTSGSRTYHWSTTVLVVMKFVFSDGQVATDERIRKVVFKVLWKADVKADARFHNIVLEDVKFENKEFRSPTPEEVQQFNLDSYTTPHEG